MRILHIISGLEMGGAENMLARLVIFKGAESKDQQFIISLTGLGKVGKELREKGFLIYALNAKSFFQFLSTIYKIFKIIREHKPDIIQTWMYHADLLGGIAGWLAGCKNIVWGIRNTSIPQNGLSLTRFIILVSALLSNLIPKKIICCAVSARAAHIALGYSADRMCVIPNGYDFSILSPLEVSIKYIKRSEMGIKEGQIVVGVVGRFDPLKDYLNFINAAKLILKKDKNVFFLMIGRNVSLDNKQILEWISNPELLNNFILLGERSDIPTLMGLMDIFCLPSLSEGFPNVLAEAMAVGLPCVTTDVGDAKLIAGSAGLVVAPQNSEDLAYALMKLIVLSPAQLAELGKYSRSHIQAHYSLESVLDKYETIYQSIQ